MPPKSFNDPSSNRVFRKVWKTQHQNPEFGPRQGEIQKNLQKSAFKGGETQKCTIFLGGKLSFILF
jgi:hypothetical protein